MAPELEFSLRRGVSVSGFSLVCTVLDFFHADIVDGKGVRIDE